MLRGKTLRNDAVHTDKWDYANVPLLAPSCSTHYANLRYIAMRAEPKRGNGHRLFLFGTVLSNNAVCQHQHALCQCQAHS